MRRRIELWKHIYDIDANAITKALSKMAWDLATFTCVNEMVRQAPDTPNGKRLNGLVLDMLASGFWSNMLQGVRRLFDRETIHGKRGVCSIGGLIQDVRNARGQLTRRVFVEDIAGLEYNFEAIRRRYWDFVLSKAPGPVWVPRDLDYEASERRHNEFDWLSGTTPTTSHPDDLIRPAVFDALDRRLARLENVVDHVNVQIAHAATEASRAGRVLEQWEMEDAKLALKDLAEIAQMIGNWFCYSGIGTVLPTPQFDQFEHVDQPLFTGDTVDLQAIWDGIDRETGQWHNVDTRQLDLDS